MGVKVLTDNNLSSFVNAVNGCDHGDIIFFPKTPINFGLNQILLPKNISLLGFQGQSQVYTELISSYDVQPIRYTALIPGYPVRISGIRFEGILDSNNHNNLIKLNGTLDKLIIDHCYFTHGGAHSLMIDGDIRGVIHHSDFIDDAVESISTRNGVRQNEIWTEQPGIGYSDGNTDKGIYIEDCTFRFLNRGTHAITSVNGQRTIFRKNLIESTFAGALIDFHGNFENDRGTYSFEVYDNEIIVPSEVYVAYGVYARSGKGVIYNNNFRVSYANRLVNPICLTNYRSWSTNQWHPAHPDCQAHGLQSNVHSYADARLYDSIRETYCWNNKLYNAVPLGVDTTPIVLDRGHDRDHIQVDRDYFNYAMPGYVELPYPHALNINPDKSYPISTGVSA